MKCRAILLAFLLFGAGFEVFSQQIIINEVMYHPLVTGLDTAQEWIELYNPGAAPVNLTGWRLTNGVDFAFTPGTTIQPGGYLVVCANVATFRSIYPSVANAVGPWLGSLSNNGESIDVLNPAGDRVDHVKYATDGDWGIRRRGAQDPAGSGPRGWEWFASHDGSGPSLELINPAMPHNEGQNWAPSPSGGTPGARNSVYATNIAPIITDLQNVPVIPQSFDSVSISARVQDEQLSGVTVQLWWRTGSNPFNPVQMSDDGTSGDGAPGDGIYGVVLPANASGTLVEFYVQATDSSNNSRTWPAAAYDEFGNLTQTANALYQVDDTVYNGTQPFYRLVMSVADRQQLQLTENSFNQSDAAVNATLVTVDAIETLVRHNCAVRIRGAGSRGTFPHNYRVDIPNDRKWKGTDQLNLNTQYTHAQVVGSAIAKKAGLAVEDGRTVQVRVNGVNLANAGSPQWGSYNAVLPFNADWAQQNFPHDPEGNLYRISTGTHNADLRYLGTDYRTYTSGGYAKTSNKTENDWTDLFNFTLLLSTTPPQQFKDTLSPVMDFREWMRYFAVIALMEYSETALGNGYGDDFSLYHGVKDPRFLILAHDFDTIFGQGGAGNVNENIFIAAQSGRQVLTNLFYNPDFVPIYYDELNRLLNTTFTEEQLFPIFDRYLTGLVPQSTIDSMKNFATARNAYVRSQIPLAITITTNLPVANGYMQSSGPTATLSGRANAIKTRRVMVNGAPASWNAVTATWTAANVSLIPGINKILVQAFGDDPAEFDRAYLEVWYNSGTVTSVNAVTSDTTWTAAGGPYLLTGNVDVDEHTLIIEPGTTIYVPAGTSIRVSDVGRLVAEGTELRRIRFTRQPGTSGRWSEINFANTTTESRLVNVDIEYSGSGGHSIGANNAVLYFDGLTFANTAGGFCSLDNSAFIVRNSKFPDTSGAEPIHGVGIRGGGYAIIEGNTFGTTTGLNDIIDFTGGQRPGPILQILNNTFTGASDDVLDLDGTDAHVEGNIFMHVHQATPGGDTSSAISGGADSGNTSEVTIVRNLFFDCDHAILAKEGNFYTIVNNTMVNITQAAVNFDEPLRRGQGVTPGLGAYLDGNIIWNCATNFENVYVSDPTFGTTQLAVNRSILSGSDFVTGIGNILSDPRLQNTNAATITAANIRSALALRPSSPAVKAGPNGIDIGGAVPAGASVSGEPPSNTYLTSATLTVDGPGITHYRYKLNNGTYGAETPISTPITLSGLANGTYTVSAIGKNSAGVYQPTNSPTVSRSWTVNTSLAGVRINEVLARNQHAVSVGGEFPDLIELYNTGNAAVDIGGMSISDDPAAPKKFVFPAGTTIGAGQYLLLYADNGSGPGIWLGFALDQNGDDVYLFNADSTVRDSITFGLQIPDFSLGRLNDGTWGLTRPTLGAANVGQPTADPHSLKINEWLASGRALEIADFVELYNPEPTPVNVGGMFLTDAPQGGPARHRIPALSFLNAFGLFAFTADGDLTGRADHLNFHISSDQGQIGLFDSGTNLVDCVVYGPQAPDISEGRLPNGNLVLGKISPPTPGSPNPGLGGTPTVTNITLNVFPMLTPWKYHAQGQDLGTDWRNPDFDDSTWGSGNAYVGNENCNCLPAPVGPGINTLLSLFDSSGSTRIVTYYFRKTFVVTNVPSDFNLAANIVLDDGAIVYLNGVEALRVRLNGGGIGYFTQANSVVSDATLESFQLQNVTLQPGTNVLAVEVHQGGIPSSDIVWGMSLDAVKTITNVNTLKVALNEIMANNLTITNDGVVTDWVELYNPSTNSVDLAGMSLSDDVANPRRFVFPPGSIVGANGYLVVHCDPDSPASTNSLGPLNTGFGLSAGGDELFLFNTPAAGGEQLGSIAFGIQAADFSIARFPEAFGPWQLALPTPGSVNVPAALAPPGNVRVNEWLANPSGNDEDFFELYNPNPQPVDLSGLYLTDNLNNRTQHRIADLSFVGVGEQGFVRFTADGSVTKGADHVSFRLSANGESIGLFTATGGMIDAINFGSQQNGVSEGRFPDGSDNITRFPGTGTPGASNLRALTDIVINEVLTHTDPPLEDSIELYNPTVGAVDVSGWYLSDKKNDQRKFRIPNGTIIQPGGFAVFYEHEFNPTPGFFPSFALSSAKGDEVFLFSADASGNLSGYRTSVKFGPSENGVSFGQYETSLGFDFPSQSQRTLGERNAYPLVGPVVINEIMYHPPDQGTNDDSLNEFIELLNITGAPVSLYNSTNTWRLRDAVDFNFPPSITLPAAGSVLVVSFDPATNATALAAFRSRYSLTASVPILGPYEGKLANDSENLELYKPDDPVESGPDTGLVPYILVEKVKYADSHPWPSAADGNTNGIGASLQRRFASQYGNDPVNWLAGRPTPGAATGSALSTLPSITTQPQSKTVPAGTNATFSVVASGSTPLRYQWRFLGTNIPGATNTSLTLSNVQLRVGGNYSVLVANSVGAILSQKALLTVEAAPLITRQPANISVAAGGNALFTVTAEGTLPLTYQWQFNSTDLPGETNPTLLVGNVQASKEGDYRVIVSNAIGSVTSDPANLTISAAPVILVQPQGTNVFVGATVSFRVVANGTAPLRYQWRLNNNPVSGATNSTLTIDNVQLAQAGNYSVRVTNSFGVAISADATVIVVVPPQINVTATDASASESGGNTGLFTVTRSGSLGSSLTVFFNVGGTASFGTDYGMPGSPITFDAGVSSIPLLVTPGDDSERESAETVTVTIAPSTEYAVGPSSSAIVTIADNDNIPPVVNITSPGDNSRFALPTNIVVAALATDSDGPIRRVEFYFDGTNKIGEALASPYTVGWSNPPAGTHLVTAVAIDDVGASTTSPTIHLTFAPPGFADLFVERGILTGYTNSLTGNNSTYTKEAGEPRHHDNGSGNGTRSAWISWIAPASGTVTMDTLGSSFDTVLCVYTNTPPSIQTVSNLVKVAANDDLSQTTFQSRVSFSAIAGVAYQIAVDGYSSSSFGNISFHMGIPNPNPVIVAQPTNQLVNPGASATFTVSASGPGPLSYQWQFNSADIPNATNATLTLNNVQQVNTGPYRVIVRNPAGQVISASATLTLRTAPTISTGLTNIVVNPGGNAAFSVAVSGSGPFTYQWRFNGVLVSGAVASTYGRSNIQYTNGGTYAVTVSNGAGSAVSQAELIVRPQLISSSISANGALAFKVLGTPGKSFAVQTSTNFTDWSEIGAVTNQAVQGNFEDPSSANAPRRLYRLRVQ